MKKKFVLYWVISILSTMVVSSRVEAADVTILLKGHVLFEDGAPVQSGTVIVRELYGAVGQMPDVRYVAVRSTNLDGYFEAKIESVHGALHIELVPDRCDWNSDYVTLSADNLRTNPEVVVELRPRREVCSRAGVLGKEN